MKTLSLDKFCFCIELRKGCLIMGVLGIIGRTLAGIGSGIGWIYIVPIAMFDAWRAIIAISNGVVGITAGVLILVGVMKDQIGIIKLYLFTLVILIVLLLVSVILSIVTVNSSIWRSQYNTYECRKDEICMKTVIWTSYAFSLDVIDFFAYIYFFFCSNSYLQKTKKKTVNKTYSQCPNEEYLMT